MLIGVSMESVLDIMVTGAFRQLMTIIVKMLMMVTAPEKPVGRSRGAPYALFHMHWVGLVAAAWFLALCVEAVLGETSHAVSDVIHDAVASCLAGRGQ